MPNQSMGYGKKAMKRKKSSSVCSSERGNKTSNNKSMNVFRQNKMCSPMLSLLDRRIIDLEMQQNARKSGNFGTNKSPSSFRSSKSSRPRSGPASRRRASKRESSEPAYIRQAIMDIYGPENNVTENRKTNKSHKPKKIMSTSPTKGILKSRSFSYPESQSDTDRGSVQTYNSGSSLMKGDYSSQYLNSSDQQCNKPYSSCTNAPYKDESRHSYQTDIKQKWSNASLNKSYNKQNETSYSERPNSISKYSQQSQQSTPRNTWKNNYERKPPRNSGTYNVKGSYSYSDQKKKEEPTLDFIYSMSNMDNQYSRNSEFHPYSGGEYTGGAFTDFKSRQYTSPYSQVSNTMDDIRNLGLSKSYKLDNPSYKDRLFQYSYTPTYPSAKYSKTYEMPGANMFNEFSKSTLGSKSTTLNSYTNTNLMNMKALDLNLPSYSSNTNKYMQRLSFETNFTNRNVPNYSENFNSNKVYNQPNSSSFMNSNFGMKPANPQSKYNMSSNFGVGGKYPSTSSYTSSGSSCPALKDAMSRLQSINVFLNQSSYR